MQVHIAPAQHKIYKQMKELKIGNLLAKVPIVQGGMGVGISLSGLARQSHPQQLPEGGEGGS